MCNIQSINKWIGYEMYWCTDIGDVPYCQVNIENKDILSICTSISGHQQFNSPFHSCHKFEWW
jgi:hypothetical protein